MSSARITGALLAILALGAIALAGCGAGGVGEASCSSQGAIDTTAKLISDQIEKDSTAKSKRDDGTFAVSISNIRASIAQLKIAIEDIRTTKSDPDSTKKFCTGTAKITFPLKILTDADGFRASKNLNTVSQLADAVSAQKNADTISFNIDYDIQPTDDKTKIYAESDSIDPQMQFISEVLVSALLKPEADSQQAAEQQQAIQQQEITKQADQTAHDQEVANNKLSIEAISAAWNAVPDATRAQILPMQRAWIESKNSDCKTQSLSAATDPVEQDTARLKCDTAANQSRIDWLKQYMPQGMGQ